MISFRLWLSFLFFIGLAPQALGQYTVRGKLEYQDREFNLSGFTGQAPYLPIRFADVRILRGPTLLAQGATNAQGQFSVQISDPTAGAITVLCIADSTQTPGFLLQVRVGNPDGTPGDFYSVSSGDVSVDGRTDVDIGTVRASRDLDIGKAFNIWDCAVNAFQFIQSLEGQLPRQQLTLSWRSDGSDNSFISSASRITVGRTDGYDDTVILHEIGHYAQTNYSRADSPGGVHFIGDDRQDIRLSWSEGWATFFGSSVRLFKGFPRPDIYVNTDGVNTLSFSFEIERLEGGAPTLFSKTGSTNEVAVAAALWDIIDGPATDDQTAASDDENLERPFSDVWRVMTQYIRADPTPGVTIEDLWDGWFSPQINQGFAPAMEDAFSRVNGMDYLRDAFESDDQSASARSEVKVTPGAAAPGANIVINEIDVGLVDGIELYNSGTEPLNLMGWLLENYADSTLVYRFIFPRIALGPGAFVRITEGNGTPEPFELFMGVNLPWSNTTSGAVLLKNNAGDGIDFVRWGSSTVAPARGTDWFGGNSPIPPGDLSLARNLRGTDTDRAADFTAQRNSMGTFNRDVPLSERTFYPAGDLDILSFNGVAGMYYLLETIGLRNGADTVLTLVDRDGTTPLLANDDTNHERLSRIAWMAPATGAYYLMVSRFSEASNFANYGTYTVRIIEREMPFAVPEPMLWRVSKTEGQGEFRTIVDAIARASSDDTIEILDSSTYEEELLVNGVNLTLRAAPGAGPRLSGRGGNSVAVINIEKSKRFSLEGLYITDGRRGVRAASSLGVLQNCIITRALESFDFSDGVVAVDPGTSVQINNSTIYGNARYGLGAFSGARASLVNSIVAANGGGDLSGLPADRVAFSLIGNGVFAGSNGNMAGLPVFANAAAGDFRLLASSPGIDAGSNLFAAPSGRDYFSNLRILDGNGDGTAIVDMGAAEFAPEGVFKRIVYFPQVADGGGYTTTFVLMNTSSATASAALELSDAQGGPLVVTMEGQTDSRFLLTIPAGGVARVTTQGNSAAPRTGWARLFSTAPVGGTAIFQLKSGGQVLSEAGVEAAQLTTRFTIFQDSRASADTGLALANPNISAAGVKLRLVNRNGIDIAAAEISLGAGQQIARFISQLMPAARDIEGTVVVSSNLALAAIALRFDNPGLTAFTTLPILSENTAAISFFPQVADGGGFTTMFVLVNPAPVPATALLELFASGGGALEVNLGGQTGSQFNLLIPPRGVLRLTSRGEAVAAQTGWGKLTSNVPVGGTAIFQLRAGSTILSEASVDAAYATTAFSIFQDSRNAAETGVALANPGVAKAEVRLQLLDAMGFEVASSSLTLEAGRHTAVFISQLMPQAAQFEGSAVITSSAPIAAVALRFDNPGLTAFTTLPILSPQR